MSRFLTASRQKPGKLLKQFASPPIPNTGLKRAGVNEIRNGCGRSGLNLERFLKLGQVADARRRNSRHIFRNALRQPRVVHPGSTVTTWPASSTSVELAPMRGAS